MTITNMELGLSEENVEAIYSAYGTSKATRNMTPPPSVAKSQMIARLNFNAQAKLTHTSR